MRQRAKPAFTVEVKRGNKITRASSIPTNTHSRETYRSAEAALFGASPAVPARERAVAAGVFASEQVVDAGQSPPVSRRVLPDLIAADQIATRAREEAAHRESQKRTARTTRVGREIHPMATWCAPSPSPNVDAIWQEAAPVNVSQSVGSAEVSEHEATISPSYAPELADIVQAVARASSPGRSRWAKGEDLKAGERCKRRLPKYARSSTPRSEEDGG